MDGCVGRLCLICLWDSLSSTKYSLLPLLHKWFRVLFRCLVRLRSWVGSVVNSSSPGSNRCPRSSGRLNIRRPTIRCDGVSGSSKSPDDKYDKGLELIIDSISTIDVWTSSRESLAWPIIFFRQRLVDFTILSKTPPHHGALSILNIQSIPTPARWFSTTLSWNSVFRSCCFESFPIVRDELPWHSPPCSEPLQASDKRLSRQICHNFQMNCSNDAAREETNPCLVHRRWFGGMNVYNSCVHERWLFLHSKLRQWRWWWTLISCSFKPPADNTAMDKRPHQAPSLHNPELPSGLRQRLLDAVMLDTTVCFLDNQCSDWMLARQQHRVFCCIYPHCQVSPGISIGPCHRGTDQIASSRVWISLPGTNFCCASMHAWSITSLHLLNLLQSELCNQLIVEVENLHCSKDIGCHSQQLGHWAVSFTIYHIPQHWGLLHGG